MFSKCRANDSEKKKISREQGFTLIEILIIVAILLILAVIAVPGLLRARMSSNEAAASGALKTIATGQTDYFNNTTAPRTFATNLSLLGTGNKAGGVNYIDPELAKGTKSGYTFKMIVGEPEGNDGAILSWFATCWPVTYKVTGIRSYYIDQHGLIRGSDIGGIQGNTNLPPME